MAPWPDCEPATPSLTAGLQLTQRPRQLAPGRPTSVSCCMPPWQSRPAPPLRATIVVSVWLSHAVLIPIYWNRAWIVRLPLPISPCVNASAPPFGGSGLTGDVPVRSVAFGDCSNYCRDVFGGEYSDASCCVRHGGLRCCWSFSASCWRLRSERRCRAVAPSGPWCARAGRQRALVGCLACCDVLLGPHDGRLRHCRRAEFPP